MSAAVAVAVASASGAPSPYSLLNSWNSTATSPTITSNTLAKGLVAYAEEEEEERDTASDVGESNPKKTSVGDNDNEQLSPDALVVDEVWQLVSDTFLPVRNDISVGFDREAWNALREESVVKNPPNSRQEAYEYVRGMLSTLNDPFTRFVAPDFQELLKYDISGVGLNIAEMPDKRQVGVLGLVAESAAQKRE